MWKLYLSEFKNIFIIGSAATMSSAATHSFWQTHLASFFSRRLPGSFFWIDGMCAAKQKILLKPSQEYETDLTLQFWALLNGNRLVMVVFMVTVLVVAMVVVVVIVITMAVVVVVVMSRSAENCARSVYSKVSQSHSFTQWPKEGVELSGGS